MDTEVKDPKEDEPVENSAESSKDTRLLVAIGDLHGDYYRLERLLRENDLILPGTSAWNPQASQVDLILIGDYVDWRNEPLEGPQSEWVQGAKRILDITHYFLLIAYLTLWKFFLHPHTN